MTMCNARGVARSDEYTNYYHLTKHFSIFQQIVWLYSLQIYYLLHSLGAGGDQNTAKRRVIIGQKQDSKSTPMLLNVC